LATAAAEATDVYTLIMLQPVSFSGSALQTQVQNGSLSFSNDSGAANAYAVSYLPAIGTLVNGMVLSFQIAHGNTGASTLSVNGGAAKPIYGNGHIALSGGEFVAGGFVEVMWNATLGAWILLENTGGSQQIAGNLSFVGTGNRITGDFSNNTVANRVLVQSSTANGNTVLGLIPNGTANTTALNLYSAADPANATLGQLAVYGTEVRLQATQTGTGTNGALTFYTAGSEHMRISNTGAVLVGTTTNGGVGSYTGGMHQIVSTSNTIRQLIQGHATGTGYGTVYVNGNEGGSATSAVVFLSSTGSVVGSITASTSATAFNTTSDYRLKHQVVKIEGALERVMALKPSKYAYKHDPDQREHEGFLAHELAEHVPHAVTGEKDAIRHHVEFAAGYDPHDVQPEDVLDVEEEMVIQQVDYSKLVPVLTAALQELTLELRASRAEVAALRKEVNALKRN
jgi:hypothetical protein